MKIIDHEPHTWFFGEENGNLYLDVACSHGAVGYSVLIELSAEERAQYIGRGRDYLNWLAEDIHNSAPGVVGSRSKYKDRQTAREVSERFNIAVQERRN